MSEPKDVHYVRVEVTAAVALIDPTDQIVGKNLVDATLAFGMGTADPGPRSDPEINSALAQQLSKVLALLASTLILQGWIEMGQTEEPMAEAKATVVGHRLSSPVTVQVVPAGDAHD